MWKKFIQQDGHIVERSGILIPLTVKELDKISSAYEDIVGSDLIDELVKEMDLTPFELALVKIIKSTEYWPAGFLNTLIDIAMDNPDVRACAMNELKEMIEETEEECTDV